MTQRQKEISSDTKGSEAGWLEVSAHPLLLTEVKIKITARVQLLALPHPRNLEDWMRALFDAPEQPRVLANAVQ